MVFLVLFHGLPLSIHQTLQTAISDASQMNRKHPVPWKPCDSPLSDVSLHGIIQAEDLLEHLL
jgi:hypothetical protein